MTTIRQVVEQNVDRSYIQHGARAITALERREQQAVAALRRYAEGRGLQRGEVDSLLQDAGLMERPQTQAASGGPAQVSLEGIAADLQRLHQRLDSASEQAGRHGIRF